MICFLFCLYIIYCVYFLIAVGFENFFYLLDWSIFSKLFLFIFPIYSYLFYKLKGSLKKYDYFFIFSPILFWIILISIVGGKSSMNALIVEPPIIGILSGIYLFKFVNKKNTLGFVNHSFKASIIIYLLILTTITVIHFVLPYIPE